MDPRLNFGWNCQGKQQGTPQLLGSLFLTLPYLSLRLSVSSHPGVLSSATKWGFSIRIQQAGVVISSRMITHPLAACPKLAPPLSGVSRSISCFHLQSQTIWVCLSWRAPIFVDGLKGKPRGTSQFVWGPT